MFSGRHLQYHTMRRFYDRLMKLGLTGHADALRRDWWFWNGDWKK